ncbi:uncharacterized protein H6S33_007456 [Morchella sextelata]|uniref:uncharacterized protein n=1 Tax=Morchella sextelata TaxID=1174677 RepID=UPI001D05573C|nr:uncharacterized protein H6S33_007456 [Morchella sextelata]KAH0603797.1 hypothetical protein H6S33_007456 [Morchella sextelata]
MHSYTSTNRSRRRRKRDNVASGSKSRPVKIAPPLARSTDYFFVLWKRAGFGFHWPAEISHAINTPGQKET